MSYPMGDPAIMAVQRLCETYLRPVNSWSDDGSGNLSPVFVPALSASEQTTFDRIERIARSLVPGITPAEWQAIQSDIDGLVTYQNLASPTLAQTVLAVRAQSRILRAILKN